MDWYQQRFDRLRRWVKEEVEPLSAEVATRYFSICANGSAEPQEQSDWRRTVHGLGIRVDTLRAENQRLRDALSTLAAKLPAPNVLDAVDDDGMTGARAVTVRLTIAEARALWAVIPPALPVRGGR